ncbi:MAG: 4-oxalocrotonate tautomerase, partial [Cyanobacteria bacterium P01_H01_bin.58]
MLQRLPALLATSLTLLTVITTTIACTAQPEPPTDTVSQAPTDSQWQEVGQLPTPLESHQMLPLGDFVYIIGGWNETKGIHEDAWFTRQNPAGTLDDWQPTTAPLPMKLQHHMTIAHNDAIYVLGGDNGFWDGSSVSDLILRAVPTEDGDITEWAEVGELPEPLTIHAVAMTGDRVYVVGGSNTFRPGDTNMIDRVFTAVITPEGEFEPFETLDPFPTVI